MESYIQLQKDLKEAMIPDPLYIKIETKNPVEIKISYEELMDLILAMGKLIKPNMNTTRRNNEETMHPLEKKINECIRDFEQLESHELLTNAQLRLIEAKNLLGDWLDNDNIPKSPKHFNAQAHLGDQMKKAEDSRAIIDSAMAQKLFGEVDELFKKSSAMFEVAKEGQKALEGAFLTVRSAGELVVNNLHQAVKDHTLHVRSSGFTPLAEDAVRIASVRDFPPLHQNPSVVMVGLMVDVYPSKQTTWPNGMKKAPGIIVQVMNDYVNINVLMVDSEYGVCMKTAYSVAHYSQVGNPDLGFWDWHGSNH